MKKKALILDLDNTIYPVNSIGDEVFDPILNLIGKHDEHYQKLDSIKLELMRKPFQKVAAMFQFSDKLLQEGLSLLSETRITSTMRPFEDYEIAQTIALPKFLITTGFTIMQQSKVDQLGIRGDFEEIHVVDPMLGELTKKDSMVDIMDRHSFDISEMLVVGDDPNSEIMAAKELGIDAVLFDKMNFNPNINDMNRITTFHDLSEYL